MSVTNPSLRSTNARAIIIRRKFRVEPHSEGPIKQKAKILEFPIPKRVHESAGKIGSDLGYTLTEAAQLTGIKRSTLKVLTSPTKSDGRVRFESEPSQSGKLIKGRVLLEILEEYISKPVELVPLEKLHLQLKCGKAKINSALKTIDGRRVFIYSSGSGKAILVPLYKQLGDIHFSLDKRAFDFIQRNEEEQRQRITWPETLKYLKDRGVNLTTARLRDSELSGRNRKIGVSTKYGLTIVYPLLSGDHITIQLKQTRTRPRTTDRPSVEKLCEALLQEQREYIKKTDFVKMAEKELPGSKGASYLPFNFTLDGMKFRFELKTKRAVSYIRRDVAEAYIEWKKLKFHKKHRRLADIYKGMNKELTERRRQILEGTREVGALQFVLSRKYGIAVRIRECSGAEKVKKENVALMKFYLSIKGGYIRDIALELNRLRDEVGTYEQPKRAGLMTLLKLWVLRDIYINLKREDPGCEAINAFFTEHIIRVKDNRTRKTKRVETNRALLFMGVSLDELSKRCTNESEIVMFDPRPIISPYNDSPLSLAQESAEGNGR